MSSLYHLSLKHILPGISSLDVIAAFRLCIALRQLNILHHHKKSYIHRLATTLIVVYAGEAVTAPLLGVPPSFILSGLFPCFYAAVQAIVDALPAVPAPSIHTELPLALVDGFTRAFLLCSLIPPQVTANPSPVLSASPWALLFSALVVPNAGFFVANLFSLFNPAPLALATPPELLPYGWTNLDLWCAPLITAIYALLTHAQPFWADAHHTLVGFLGTQSAKQPMHPDDARSVCALILSALFAHRAVRTFTAKPVEKTKTQ